jgi:hypothetical protein
LLFFFMMDVNVLMLVFVHRFWLYFRFVFLRDFVFWCLDLSNVLEFVRFSFFWWMLSFWCLSLSNVFDLVCLSFFGGSYRCDACLYQSFETSFVFIFLMDVVVLMLVFVNHFYFYFFN